MPGIGGVVSIDVAFTFAVWVEMFLYGIYTCLFTSAICVMLKRRTDRAPATAWIFLASTIVMYMVATLHMILMLYRFIRAYILVDPGGGFNYYFLQRWDNTLNNILLCSMSWLGDCLVIFRCYYVWGRNFWIILLPLLLLIITIGVNSYILFWFTHPYSQNLDFSAFITLLNSVYPLAFTQNFLTTGLISLKIWKQHRASSASGVIDRGSRLSLIQVLRIVIESAMVYTLQMLILIILYFRGDNVQIIVQTAVVPSIGIVFVLIAVRVHTARTRTVIGTGLGTIPAWLDEGDIAVELSAHGSSSTSAGPDVTFRVAGAANSLDRNRHDGDSDPFSSSSYSRKVDIGDKI